MLDEDVWVKFVKVQKGRLQLTSNCEDFLGYIQRQFTIPNPMAGRHKWAPQEFTCISPIYSFKEGLAFDIIKKIRAYNNNIEIDVSEIKDVLLPFSMKEFELIQPENKNIRYYDYQEDAINRAMKYGRGCFIMATGCHSKGTKIIRPNGTFENVENIKIGDTLLGPSGVRTVKNLCRGSSKMYKLEPKRGKPFIVNEDHILHLKFTGGSKSKNRCGGKDYINISVKDYLNETLTFKHETKLVYNNKVIKFNNKKNCKELYNIEPYFIGLYLGDGHTHACAITSMDKEIVDYCENISKQYNLILKEKLISPSNKAKTYCFNVKKHGGYGFRHPIFEIFDEFGLHFGCIGDRRIKCCDKFIPDIIKYGTYEDRIECIAGLIDSDGYLGRKNFEFCVSSHRLAEDMAFTCRSVGLHVYETEKIVNEMVYYKLSITGDTSIIPTKLKRKQSQGIRKDRSSYLHGFDIKYIGDDKFYGFTLDGDHLYYLDDFCITHNSGKTLIQYGILKNVMHNTNVKRTLILVPNVDLLGQLADEFVDEYGCDPDDICKYAAKTNGGVDVIGDQPIIISNRQFLDRGKRWGNIPKDVGLLLIDEAHGLSNGSAFVKNVIKLNIKKCFGFTGTESDWKLSEWDMKGICGRILKTIRAEYLQKRGFLTKNKMISIQFEHWKKFKLPPEEQALLEHAEKNYRMNPDKDNYILLEKVKQEVNKVWFPLEWNFIENCDFVNDFIIKCMNKFKGNSIILFDHIVHGKKLFKQLEQLNNASDNPKRIYYVDGSTKVKYRKQVREEMEIYDNCVLVGNTKCIGTGINIKNIDNIGFAFASGKSVVKIIQAIGRGLRKKVGKKHVLIIDFNHSLTYSKKHFAHRLKLYKIHYGITTEDIMFKSVEVPRWEEKTDIDKL